MLKKRVITALWLIPLLVVTVWFGEPWFTILVAIWGGLAVFEFYRLVTASKVSPLTYFGLVWTLLFIVSRDSGLLATLGPRLDLSLIAPLLLTSAIALSLICLLTRRQKEGAFASWAWTMAGILYVGWLLSYLISLRGLDDGRNWVFFALFTTFASDTGAFLVGSALGKRKLAPNISPRKTWEGAIGGAVSAMLVSLLFLLPWTISLNQHLNWGQAILLGFLVSIMGQLGDLAESLLKRSAGVKESGKLMPGHGGMLDRVDSIVFAGISVYYAWLAYTAGWLDWL